MDNVMLAKVVLTALSHVVNVIMYDRRGDYERACAEREKFLDLYDKVDELETAEDAEYPPSLP